MDRLILAGVVSAFLALYLRSRRQRRIPYPPGPKQLPIIGNVLDMPPSDEWEAGRRWGEEYGKTPV